MEILKKVVLDNDLIKYIDMRVKYLEALIDVNDINLADKMWQDVHNIINKSQARGYQARYYISYYLGKVNVLNEKDEK